MSRYLIEPIRYKEDFHGTSGSSKTAQKCRMGDFQKRRQSWHTFFKVMVEIQCFLDSSHVRVPYGPDETNQTQWGFRRSRQECQKQPKKGQKDKKGDFQRRRQSWHTSLMVSVETQDVLYSSHGGVTYETDQRQKDLKRAIRYVQNMPKMSLKAKQLIFKEDGSFDTFFSWFWERLNVFWISYMSGYLMDLIKLFRDDEDFKGDLRNVKNGPKKTKKVKKGDFQRRRQSWHTFSIVLGDTQVVLGFSLASVAYGTNQRQ